MADLISASHNPGEWNGFKIVRSKSVPVSGDTGLKIIKDLILDNKLSLSSQKGTISVENGLAKEQLAHDLKYFNREKIKPLKIVADTASGMGAQYLFEFFKGYQ
jgi:phosphomannomutase